MSRPLTEKEALRRLHALAKRWPANLWMFAGDGTLAVMRRGANGERVMSKFECVDQDYIVDTIDIPCDGGGW